MTKYIIEEGMRIPYILCDICQKPISGARSGAVVFQSPFEDVQNGDIIDVLYAHKGDCHTRADEKLSDLFGIHDRYTWIELPDHLADLLDNAKVILEGIQKSQNRSPR